ncbi:MAG: hypothetical protein M3376_03060 [Actinomycetota bacterium]|nr:hypothetical protein [Actinomycetota bacterium]
MAMTLDEALLTLNDRLGQEVTAWIEVTHETPLLIATGLLENWSHETTSAGAAEPARHFDLRGHYSIADARFDLSDAPVEMVSERQDGMTFRLAGGTRFIVTWTSKVEGDLV